MHAGPGHFFPSDAGRFVRDEGDGPRGFMTWQEAEPALPPGWGWEGPWKLDLSGESHRVPRGYRGSAPELALPKERGRACSSNPATQYWGKNR